MKSGVSVLYPNSKVAEKVSTYSEAKSTGLPEHLITYHAHIEKEHKMANYMISNFQAQMQVWLAHMVGARRVLEIGVYVGYSSMVWAHAVGPEGTVTGLEYDDGYAKLAEEAFVANGVKNAQVIRGDALEVLPTLNPDEPYDIIFIDAQKSGYPNYLASILKKSQPGASNRLLRPGGLIIADNVLRRGLVADESDDNPNANQEKVKEHWSQYQASNDLVRLREFNDQMATDPRLEAWLMPLFDGVGMARLRD